MAFSGEPQILQVSDNKIRILGVVLDGGGTGTISLAGAALPFDVGVADIELPAGFRPANYGYSLHEQVSTQDSVQVSLATVFTPAASNIRYAIAKSGAYPSSFLITVINLSNGPSSILGAAQPFAVLARTSVENSFGGTTVTGDVGVSPGATVTGFPPGTINGTVHAGDQTAATAMRDAVIAYQTFAAMPPTHAQLAPDLGGVVLGPGVYSFADDAHLDGTLTLATGGDPNAFWVFQVPGDFTMAANAIVSVDDANAVFWQVGGSAAFGTTCQGAGTFLAMSEVIHQSATVLPGRAIALTGGVVLEDCVVTVPNVPGGFQSSSSGPLEIYVQYH